MRHLYLILLTVSAFAIRANATIYTADDLTINGFENDSVVAGYANSDDALFNRNPTSPTITVTGGADDTNSITLENGSTLNMDSGFLDAVFTGGSSTSNISGGELAAAAVSAEGTLQISGGFTDYGAGAVGSGTFIFSGGDLDVSADPSHASNAYDTTFYESSTGVLTGGTIHGFVDGKDSSKITANGVTILGGVQLSSNAGFSMSGETTTIASLSTTDTSAASTEGGVVSGSVTASGQSLVRLTDSSVGSVFVTGAATANLISAAVAGDVTSNGAILTVSGGSVGGNAIARGAAPTGPSNLSLDGGVTVTGNVESHDSSVVAVANATVAGTLTTHDSSIIGSAGTLQGTAAAYDQSALLITGGTATDVYAYDNSQVNISGGTITGTVSASGNASGINQIGGAHPGFAGVVITAGTIANLEAPGGNLILAGGKVQYDCPVSGNGVSVLSGGSIAGALHASDATQVTMSGTNVGNLLCDVNAYVVFNRGTDSADATVHDGAELTISGGTVDGNLVADDTTLVFLDSGTIQGSALISGNAAFVWTGGKVLGLVFNTSNPSTKVAGDRPNAWANDDDASSGIFLADDASLEIDGTDLSATLTDADAQGLYSEYALTGSLADGTTLPSGLDLFVQNGSDTTFNLVEVPDPSSIGVGGVCAMLLLTSFRWSRSFTPVSM